jgi:hypothetical protein
VLEAGCRCSAGGPWSTRSTTRTATGPGSRFARIMPLVAEHGAAVVALTIDEEGQARTADWKVARRRPPHHRPDREWGHAPGGHPRRPLTFPIATGQEETRRDGIETIEAIRGSRQRPPDVQTVLGLSNVSFGLNPAARSGAQLGVPARVRQGRPGLRDRARGKILPLPGSPRSSSRSPSTWCTTGARGRATTRSAPSSSCSPASTPGRPRSPKAEELRRCRWTSGCERRIIDGERGAWRPTSTRRCCASRPSTSSTTPCWRA